MNAIVVHNQSQLADICRRHHVQRLDVFGSAAREDFDNDTSDLDFLVEFEPLESGQFDAYFGLKEDLESLFGRTVDLVVTRAVRNRYFLESINRHREVVYGH